MTKIKKILLSLLVFLFSWQYGANAFHDYDKLGSQSCTAFCSSYGEINVYGTYGTGAFDIAAGVFDSCICMTSTEWAVVQQCNNTKCKGTNASGYMRAYVGSSFSSGWCSPLNSQTVANCSCASGYYKTGFSSSTGETSCTVCPCGEYCTGGSRYDCPAGTYRASTGGVFSSSCTICSAGYYCVSGSCSQTKCPTNPPATSSSGVASIRSCYIPSNTSVSDSTGDYLFTSNCFYSA